MFVFLFFIGVGLFVVLMDVMAVIVSVRELFRWKLEHNWKSTSHIYEVRPRKNKGGADLISDALPYERTDNVSGRYRSVNKFDTVKATHAGVS
jgi:hypothetical protein